LTSASAPKLEAVFTIFVLGATPPPDLLVGSRIRNVLTDRLSWLADQLVHSARGAPLIYGSGDAPPAIRVLTAQSGALESLAMDMATERGWSIQRIHTSGKAGPFDPPLLVFDFQTSSHESSPAVLRKQSVLAFSDVAFFYWDPADTSQPDLVALIRGVILAHMPAIWVAPDRRVHFLDLHRLDETVRTTLLADEADGHELARLFVPLDEELMAEEIRAVVDPISAAGSAKDTEEGAGARDLLRYFGGNARDGRTGRYSGRIDKAFSALLTGGGVWKALTRDHTKPWYGVSWEEMGFEDPVVLEPDAFRRRFEYSDREANVAAGRHRDATWVLHMLSAFAVFAAVAGAIRLWVGEHSAFWALAELVAIGVIVTTVWAGKRFNWHRDWLAHRFVAEQIRYGRMGFPLLVLPELALRSATQSDPAKKTRLLNAEQWILKRTLVASGPPRTETGAYRPHASSQALRPYVVAIIQGQIDYHERTHHRLETMAHRLHLTTVVAFVATAAAVIAHLFVHVEWLLLLTAGLPAFAAALYSISTRNELERLAALSESSGRKLKHIRQAIEALEFSPRAGTRSWLRLRRLTAESTQVMSEVAQQWQQLIQKRSDSLPV
jgi:hypothetical protein